MSASTRAASAPSPRSPRGRTRSGRAKKAGAVLVPIEMRAALIIVPPHGRTGWQRALLGSTAPVMIIPTRMRK